MGLDDPFRQRGTLSHPAISLHTVHPDDLHFRDARVNRRAGKSQHAVNTYGLLAEFSTQDELVHAADTAYAVGFRKMDGYAPFPVEGLPEARSEEHTSELQS